MSKETIYEHVKGDETFTVTAAERWSVNMVKRLSEKYPGQVEILGKNEDGSLVASFPADWMRIVPKKSMTLTDEQRGKLAERMRAAREKR